MLALYERLVMVTWLPDCEELAFQICVMVCPLGNEKASDQPLMALEPVLVMESEAWNPPGHWLVMEYVTWQLEPPDGVGVGVVPLVGVGVGVVPLVGVGVGVVPLVGVGVGVGTVPPASAIKCCLKPMP